MSVAAISVQGLKKNYGKVHAVVDMDVEVPSGTVFGLIGPNGAGKTTFIKVILGIAHPTSGVVKLLGGDPSDPAIRRRVGYLPERLSLPPASTPVAFLKSIGRIKGLSSRETDAAIPRLLTEVALDESAWTRATGKFSKGMRQRTGLAGALMGDPDLLVLDEPTDGIDPIGRARIRDVIRAAHRRGATIFLNSHLLAETERLCDHVAIALDGRVVKAGDLNALRSENSFRVRFKETATIDDDAVNAGFSVDEAARKSGAAHAFHFQGTSAEDLSSALKRALDAGLIVLEVSPKMKDLEAVLEETVRAGGRS